MLWKYEELDPTTKIVIARRINARFYNIKNLEYFEIW
jgi:hypothetical protein